MSLNELMEKHRFEELKAVMRFIDKADIEEIAHILAEIRCVHDNLLVFNPNSKSLDRVKSISIDDDAIQLNLENEHDCICDLDEDRVCNCAPSNQ